MWGREQRLVWHQCVDIVLGRLEMIVKVPGCEARRKSSLCTSIGIVEGIGCCIFTEILVDLKDCFFPLGVVHQARDMVIDFIIDI